MKRQKKNDDEAVAEQEGERVEQVEEKSRRSLRPRFFDSDFELEPLRAIHPKRSRRAGNHSRNTLHEKLRILFFRNGSSKSKNNQKDGMKNDVDEKRHVVALFQHEGLVGKFNDEGEDELREKEKDDGSQN